MIKSPFEPCIPTRGTKVPAGPDWLHEIKHDGYRLIVHRDGKRVRLNQFSISREASSTTTWLS
jgi:bifunctional non-homologous end joining protein LigD